MNKSTNNYRKCDFCPHHQQKKQCCCQNRHSVHSIKTKANSRGKSKSRNTKKTLMQNSAISYINTTLPITNNSVLPHFSSNILAQNSILRTENDYLKRQLHSQHHVSAFTKDQRNISTLPSSQTDTSRTYQLHDKLYIANRNLQQALIQLDSVSRTNKELHESNTKVESEKEQLRIANEQLYEQCQKLKKKIKKLNKVVDSLPSQSDVQKIMYVNSELERENNQLKHEIEELKEQIGRMNNRSRVVQVQNLSPEWVAHTSNKINIIQKNISKLEEQNNNKQNTYINQNNSMLSCIGEQQIKQIKNQLISTIKLLKVQTYSLQFGSLISIHHQLFSNPNCSLIFLIQTLCEMLMQPVMVLFGQLNRDLDKVMRGYQGKFQRVVSRMHNMMIKMENQRLRDTSKSKYFF